MDKKSALGLRVGELRRARKWSVPELARAAGVVESTIYRLEEGTAPRSATMEKVAKALGVTVSDLFDKPTAEAAPQIVHPGVEELARDRRLREALGISDAAIAAARKLVLIGDDGVPFILETADQALDYVRLLQRDLKRA